jgi:hypothetical protein
MFGHMPGDFVFGALALLPKRTRSPFMPAGITVPPLTLPRFGRRHRSAAGASSRFVLDIIPIEMLEFAHLQTPRSARDPRAGRFCFAAH